MKSHASLMVLLIPAGQWIMKMNQKYNGDFFPVVAVINNYVLLSPTLSIHNDFIPFALSIRETGYNI